MFSLLLTQTSSLFTMGEADLRQFVFNGEKSTPWFVMFGGASCPACQNAAPEFVKASQDASGFARFAYSDVASCPNISRELKIFAIPAFFLFTQEGRFQYTGSRTKGGMIAYIAEKISEGLE